MSSRITGKQKYVRFQLENTYGAGFSGTEDITFDTTSVSLDCASDSTISVDGGMLNGETYVDQGVYVDKGDISLPLDLTTIGYFLQMASGSGDVKNGTTTFQTGNILQLDSAAIGVAKDTFEHVFCGCCVNSLAIECEKEFVSVTLGIVAKNDTVEAAKDLTTLTTINETPPASFKNVSVFIADVEAKCTKFSLNINNNITPEDGVYLGSVYTEAMYTGKIEVTGDLDIELDTANITALKNLTEKNIQIQISKNGKVLQFTMPKCVYTKCEQTTQGSERVKQSISFKALFGINDGVVSPSLTATLS